MLSFDTYRLAGPQGMNLPGARVELPAVTDQDKRDIAFAVEQKLDLIAASFIRNAAAVQEIRYWHAISS